MPRLRSWGFKFIHAGGKDLADITFHGPTSSIKPNLASRVITKRFNLNGKCFPT
jgi:hypothetical protein